MLVQQQTQTGANPFDMYYVGDYACPILLPDEGQQSRCGRRSDGAKKVRQDRLRRTVLCM